MMKHVTSERPYPLHLQKFGSPYRFTTSDHKLEQFFRAHNVNFTNQYEADGKTRWSYPWSPQVVRLLDEYNALLPFEGGEITNEDAD